MIDRAKLDPALLLILGLGFFLRVWGVSFGLPHLYHADEPIVVNHALAYGLGDFNPHFFKIPPLVSTLLFGIYGGYFLLGHVLGKFHTAQDFEFLFYRDPSSFYLLARIIFGVILGTATVTLLHRVVARHFSKPTALLSALILAVCFLHVRDSHYAYVDIPLVLLMTLALGIFWCMADGGGKLRSHVAAGTLIGLATAVKYNGIMLVIPYLMLSLAGPIRKRVLGFWALAAMAAVAGYAAFNPFSLLDFKFFWQEIKTQAHSQGGVDWLHPLRYSLVGAMGIPALGFAMAGMAQSLKNFDWKRASLVLFVLSYYLILCVAGQPYDRYVLPLLPALAFFAADFTFTLAKTWGKFRRWGLAGVIVGLTFFPLLKSVLWDRLMLSEDTRTLAKSWVEKNIPAGSRLALDWDFYMPRLAFSPRQLEEKKGEAARGIFAKSQTRKVGYLLSHPEPEHPGYNLYFLSQDPIAAGRFLFAKPLLPYDLAALKDHAVDYVLVVRIRPGRGPDGFYDRLSREGKLVAEFNPYKNQSRKFAIDEWALTGGPFLFRELWERKRNGQILQIYALQGNR